jgi:predicted nucleic acid-binding protein
MILTPNNEYCVVLDACVLIPMPLCDTLLRSAEEPSFFRIAWSLRIMDEVQKALEGPRFGYSAEQVERRIRLMNAAFPEAFQEVPQNLIDSITGLPDPNDRHVVALAIHAQAHTIVTANVRDFPSKVMAPHDLSSPRFQYPADGGLVGIYGIMAYAVAQRPSGIGYCKPDIL